MLGEEKTKALFRNYVDAMNAQDAERILSLYHPDAAVFDPVGRPPYEGIASFGPFYRNAMELSLHLEIDGEIVGTYQNTTATAINVTSPLYEFRMINVMTFDDDGLIIEMRAHWGPSAMES